jgi:dihydroneopterin aldolase
VHLSHGVVPHEKHIYKRLVLDLSISTSVCFIDEFLDLQTYERVHRVQGSSGEMSLE